MMVSMNVARKIDQHDNSKDNHSKRKAMTLEGLKADIDRENTSFILNKMVCKAMINPPLNIWYFEIDQCQCENLHDRQSSQNPLHLDPQKPLDLFSIQKITFRSTAKASAAIVDAKLRFYEVQGELAFSIRTVHYESPTSPKEPMIEIPAKDGRPSLEKPTGKSKKAIKVRFIYKDGLLFNVNVSFAPMRLHLSKLDLSEELTSVAMVKNVFGREKSSIPHLLSTKVFDPIIFDKIQNSITKKSKAKGPQYQGEGQAKAGPLSVHTLFFFSILAERITVHCVKDHQVFATFEILSLDYNIDFKPSYTATIGKLSLIPGGKECYYDNFFVNLSAHQPMKVQLLKEEEYPTLVLQNCKIIFMHKIIQELKKFKKELTEEILTNSRMIMTKNSIYDKSMSAGIKEEKEKDRENKPMMRILIKNSCIVVPRTTVSKDALFLFSDHVKVKVGMSF